MKQNDDGKTVSKAMDVLFPGMARLLEGRKEKKIMIN